MEGIAPGRYVAAERYEFCAGSYSGYNQWRDELARFAGYESAKWVFANVENGNTAPFCEIINFADNEGTIGPVAAARLFTAFVENEPRLADWKSEDGWFADRYRCWRRAFEIAADGGAVDFH